MDLSILSLVTILLPALVHAIPTPQGDPNGIAPGGVGYDPNTSGTSNQNAPGSNQANNNGGASGSDGGGMNISTGVVVGIAIGAVVLITAVGEFELPRQQLYQIWFTNYVTVITMLLFYKAHKRQWTVKEQIRHASHAFKNKAHLTPRTPKVQTFSPVEKKQAGTLGLNLIRDSRTPSPPIQPMPQPMSSLTRDETLGHHPTWHGDLEKSSYGPITRELTPNYSHSRNGSTQSNSDRGRKKRPTPPTLTVPQSKFEMDSPKTPIWQKVFGR